jgi:peptide/nickel transport system permease protein
MFARFIRIRKVQIGLGIIIFFFIMGYFGPWFAEHVIHYGPYDYDRSEAGGFPPSSIHLLGTTNTGQDVMSWMLYGANASMKVGLMSAVIGTALTVIFGLLAGFVGGWVDRILNGFTLVFQNIPSFSVLFLISGLFTDMHWIFISFIIGFFEWPAGARGIRAQALSLRGRDFATALITINESGWRIVFSETMPHLLGVISPMFLKLIAAGVNAQAGLAFMGLGNATIPSWGLIINYAMTENALFNGQWWWFVPPGLAIALLSFATTMVNFGFDEIANPTLSTQRNILMRKYLKKLEQKRALERKAVNTVKIGG